MTPKVANKFQKKTIGCQKQHNSVNKPSKNIIKTSPLPKLQLTQEVQETTLQKLKINNVMLGKFTKSMLVNYTGYKVIKKTYLKKIKNYQQISYNCKFYLITIVSSIKIFVLYFYTKW